MDLPTLDTVLEFVTDYLRGDEIATLSIAAFSIMGALGGFEFLVELHADFVSFREIEAEIQLEQDELNAPPSEASSEGDFPWVIHGFWIDSDDNWHQDSP